MSKSKEVKMILQKTAYVTNWIMLIAGYLLFFPLVLPQSIRQNNDIFSVYQEGFFFFGPFILILMLGLFASCLALILQKKHLIILSLLLFMSPFLWVGYNLLF